MLDSVFNRVIRNRALGRNTWVYIDEIYILFPLLHVHGVDVVGGGSGDIHHFAAQPFDEGPVVD